MEMMRNPNILKASMMGKQDGGQLQALQVVYVILYLLDDIPETHPHYTIITSGGARVLDRGGGQFFFRRAPNLFFYGAPLWGASIGHFCYGAARYRSGKRLPYGTPLPPEAPYPIHQPLQIMHI